MLRKNLMKSMAAYQEAKKLKLQAQGSITSDDKAEEKAEDKATFQDSSITPGEPLNLLDQPSSMLDIEEKSVMTAAASSRQESELPIKEVCCCPLSKRDKSGRIEPSQLNYCRFKQDSVADQKKEAAKTWQNIILKVQSRRRDEQGKMSYVVIATEMGSGARKPLLIDTKLIDEQNMPELGKLLKKNVNLAKRDVAIYIVISEKMLLKKARK